MVINKTDSGYVFPNIPREWTREERFFALELRNLFDRLFTLTRGLTGEWEKNNYEKLAKLPMINGVTLKGQKTLADLGIKEVTDVNAGFMSPAMKQKLDGIDEHATDTRPELDYLFMMTGIDLPTDTSDKKEKLTDYYEADRWTKEMIWDAVDKEWITSSDYEDITGDPFPPFRPT